MTRDNDEDDQDDDDEDVDDDGEDLPVLWGCPNCDASNGWSTVQQPTHTGDGEPGCQGALRRDAPTNSIYCDGCGAQFGASVEVFGRRSGFGRCLP
jgi:hypothetical protein